jgi:hypothetical protein
MIAYILFDTRETDKLSGALFFLNIGDAVIQMRNLGSDSNFYNIKKIEVII